MAGPRPAKRLSTLRHKPARRAAERRAFENCELRIVNCGWDRERAQSILNSQFKISPKTTHHSAYFDPSRALPSEPLLTSYTPGSEVGLFGSGSAGMACQVELLFVNGSSGSLRRYPSLTSASSVV